MGLALEKESAALERELRGLERDAAAMSGGETTRTCIIKAVTW